MANWRNTVATYRVHRFIERAWNWIRGYRFYWRDGAIWCSPGTCPYPIRSDWSAKACIADGNCGCDEKDKLP